jgi:hypothetical protein
MSATNENTALAMNDTDSTPPESAPPKKQPLFIAFFRKNFHDIVVWCLLLAAFRVVPYLIQKVDATSAISDFGMVHVLVYGALGASFALMTVWLILHFSFPTLDDYMDSGKFREDFKALPAQHRVWMLVAIIALLMWTFVKITGLGAGGGA